VAYRYDLTAGQLGPSSLSFSSLYSVEATSEKKKNTSLKNMKKSWALLQQNKEES